MKRTLAIAALCASISTPVYAQIPVTDAANLVQTTRNAITTIQQLQKLRAQYQQLKEQDSALTGSSGMSQIFGGQQQRSYEPNTWQQSMSILKHGGLPGKASDVSKYGQQYSKGYGFKGAKPAYENDAQNYAHMQQAQAATANLAIAKQAYNKSGKHIKRMKTYLSEIKSADTMKKATDLQNRLLVALTQATLESNRLQAAMMQLQGSDAATNSQSVNRIRQIANLKNNLSGTP